MNQPTCSSFDSGCLDLEPEVPHTLLMGLDQLLAVLLPVLHDAAVPGPFRLWTGAAGFQLRLLEISTFYSQVKLALTSELRVYLDKGLFGPIPHGSVTFRVLNHHIISLACSLLGF